MLNLDEFDENGKHIFYFPTDKMMILYRKWKIIVSIFQPRPIMRHSPDNI